MLRLLVYSLLTLALFASTLVFAQTRSCQLSFDIANIESSSRLGSHDAATYPYKTTYSRCGNTLVLVAAEYGNPPEGKTFDLLKESFSTQTPQLVILERLSHGPNLKTSTYESFAVTLPENLMTLKHYYLSAKLSNRACHISASNPLNMRLRHISGRSDIQI